MLWRFVPELYWMTHQKYCCTTQARFGNGEVLTKAIQACLTKLHFNRMNAGVWTSSENSWDSKDPTLHLVKLIYSTGTVGTEGWDTVNLAKWDALPHHGLSVLLTVAVEGRRAKFPQHSQLIFQYPLEVSKQALGLRTKSLRAVTLQWKPGQVCFSLERIMGDGDGLPGRLRVANNQCHIGPRPPLRSQMPCRDTQTKQDHTFKENIMLYIWKLW